jgi:hypothetical protein
MDGEECEGGDAEDDEHREETDELLPLCAWMITGGLHVRCLPL